MKKPIIVSLHLGAHKTATTHLQKSLTENSDLLNTAGVAYFGPSELRAPRQSIQHKFGFAGNKRIDPAFAAEALQALAGDCRRVVLSEENYLGPLYGGEGSAGLPLYSAAHLRVEKLVRSLEGHPVSLFLAVRDPASFLVSAYSQGMMSGKYVPFSKFVRRLDPSRIFWSELIERLSGIEGVANTYVWRHEDYPRVAETVLRRLVGWRLGPQIKLSEGRAHVGLSAGAVDHILNHTGKPAGPKLGRAARRLFPMTDGQSRFQPWRPEALADSRAAYDADLDRLDGIDGVTFFR
ncbi:hypothetical protein [Pseudogemmobacter sp. W21_MBD1_M6]|uniref:hypothetical protein n=1 Tax=Pseudogemmobacter sp. W21_MBD1_M6 TaxID=3240271 RepID=UPI003F9EB669